MNRKRSGAGNEAAELLIGRREMPISKRLREPGSSVWNCEGGKRSGASNCVILNNVTNMSVNPMCYETQFFGFTPQTCILRVYIAFQDYLFEMMLVVERIIMKKLESFPGCRISPFQIRESTEKYLHFINGRFNHLFQKMEQMLLKLVLEVPRNILLPEDKVQGQRSYSKEELHLLQCETERLQKQCKAETFAKQSLLAELEEQKVVQAELGKMLSWFDGLDQICREHGNIDLKESLAFMTQTSRKLQDKVEEIDLKKKSLKMTPVRLRTRKPKQESKK
ncbi:protein MIS12 homolog isoform X2 [Ascaphus truei]|uniref:protein MIS12 homolog isoform X2 n=1 Tax=Ascaphus truei TaxID=8439 RepID=UPI003F5A6257